MRTMIWLLKMRRTIWERTRHLLLLLLFSNRLFLLSLWFEWRNGIHSYWISCWHISSCALISSWDRVQKTNSILLTNKLFPLFIPHALRSSKAFLMPAFSSYWGRSAIGFQMNLRCRWIPINPFRTILLLILGWILKWASGGGSWSNSFVLKSGIEVMMQGRLLVTTLVKTPARPE